MLYKQRELKNIHYLFGIDDMFKKSLALAGFIGLTALCAQAEPQVWQGQIGSAPISGQNAHSLTM